MGAAAATGTGQAAAFELLGGREQDGELLVDPATDAPVIRTTHPDGRMQADLRWLPDHPGVAVVDLAEARQIARAYVEECC